MVQLRVLTLSGIFIQLFQTLNIAIMLNNIKLQHQKRPISYIKHSGSLNIEQYELATQTS